MQASERPQFRIILCLFPIVKLCYAFYTNFDKLHNSDLSFLSILPLAEV